NLNRLVGQTVNMSLLIHNGPSLDAGADDSQTYGTIDFFPSCLSVAGGVCTIDQGETPGPPPPVMFNGGVATTDCPRLPSVDATNPFDVKFTFSPPLNFLNGQQCMITFNVVIAERGDTTSTPA